MLPKNGQSPFSDFTVADESYTEVWRIVYLGVRSVMFSPK